MRSNTRGIIATAAVAGLLALGLVGCGDKGAGGSGGDVEGKTTINWWGFAPDVTVGEAYVAAFEAANPDIHVVYKNFENTDYAPALRPALQSDQGPDIYEISAGGNVAGIQLWTDYFHDLTPAAEAALGADWKDKFAPGYIDQLTWPETGVLSALPLGGVGAQMFWYNKTMLDDLGLEPPEDYAEWVEQCKTISDAGHTCMAMGAGGDMTFGTELLRTTTSSVDTGYWVRALKGEASWEDPVFYEGIDILRSMIEDGIIQSDAIGVQQYPEANNTFMAGQAAYVQMGTWYTQYGGREAQIVAAKAAGISDPDPFVMMPMMTPNLGGEKPGMVAEVEWGFAVNPKSKNIEAAEKFATWFTTTQEGQEVILKHLDIGLPALAGMGPNWDEIDLVDPDVQVPAYKDMYAAAAETSETRQLHLSQETANALVVAVQEALATKNTPEEIAAKVQAAAVPRP
ncbi:MAG: extracellular solute-binding protein [Bifidobacteriaceae bacterium]|jgi:ABC-type glycerol-3-phosphate transport system substrate-binding protein|nr:extracellular solute-binding protein [Bifidobacteriaceae bacterium]